jgi:hypothetical protein
MSQETPYTSALEAAHAARSAYPHQDNTQEGEGSVYYTSILVEAVGISVLRLFEEREGPFVEVGGPTPKGYDLLAVEQLPKPLVVTNADRLVSGIDKVARAQRLPFKDGTVGALFASGLPYEDHKFFPFGRFDLHKAFIGQAKRCLEESGVLVMSTATQGDIEHAVSLGLTPVSILETTATFPLQGNITKTFWDFIAMKGTPEEPLTYKATIKE